VATSEVWSDLHHDLIVDVKGSIKKVLDVDAVRTSIYNIMMTSPGERFMRPYFGAGLQQFVWETMDDAVFSSFATSIRNAIQQYDPRVIVRKFDVKPYPDDNQVNVIVEFGIVGYDQIFTLSTEMAGAV
jgi:uncharacterized protein